MHVRRAFAFRRAQERGSKGTMAWAERINRNPRIRAGDLVRVPGEHRLWVALEVTPAQLRRGVDVCTPGLHLFGGFWYQAPGGPLNNRRYGKAIAAEGTPVGRVRSAATAIRFCNPVPLHLRFNPNR